MVSKPASCGILIALLTFTTAAAGISTWIALRAAEQQQTDQKGPVGGGRPVQARGALAPAEQTTIDLFRRASPAVVHLTAVALKRDRLSFDVLAIPRGSGTGLPLLYEKFRSSALPADEVLLIS